MIPVSPRCFVDLIILAAIACWLFQEMLCLRDCHVLLSTLGGVSLITAAAILLLNLALMSNSPLQ